MLLLLLIRGKWNLKKKFAPQAEFIQELKDLKGMPDEILQSNELLEYCEPILRSDFMVSEKYIHEESAPLDIPITVITGNEEDMENSDIALWQKETTLPVDFKKFPGNHFFIYQNVQPIIQIISNKITLTTKVYQV